jgi:hypothetical protein
MSTVVVVEGAALRLVVALEATFAEPPHPAAPRVAASVRSEKTRLRATEGF